MKKADLKIIQHTVSSNLVKLLSLLLFFMFTTQSFSQDNFLRHTVKQGETVTNIAKQYSVTPYDIYRLNPDSKTGIKLGDVVLIPTKGSSKSTSQTKPKKSENTTIPAKGSSQNTHEVLAKETLFSISRQYKVNVEDLIAANPIVADGLKIGQILDIPTGTKVVISRLNGGSKRKITHEVAAKETPYGISREYGITIAELEKQNPQITEGLQIGQTLEIEVANSSNKADIPVAIPKVATVIASSIPAKRPTTYASYEVKPKETIYSLTQYFNITEAELLRLNPELSEGMKIGMILNVPATGSTTYTASSTFKDLTKSLDKSKRKELVLLLPFNASKIQGDSIRSIDERLKTDAFLNMTLDFYAGALMAIDSAKTLGLNVDVNIYDSQESKASSAVEALYKSNKLSSADVVIGPFYQQYAEKAASLLAKDSIPVISPLSKESVTPVANLYQATPPSSFTKKKLMDFMSAKSANIVMVSSPKKAANRDFVTKSYPNVRFVNLAENGSLSAENLRAILVKGKMNYVILDSEKTGMILSTTNVLQSEMSSYDLQLVLLELNETLDFEEISMKRLTTLKMMYPSLIRENLSDEATIFENSFKRQNNILPSQYAIRGFDVTFDTMLRMSQSKGFKQSAIEDKSQQVESKFEYTAKKSEGYINQGVYVLQYNEDLTIKEAN